jgi:hypothetical protein
MANFDVSEEESGLTFGVQHFSLVSAKSACWKCAQEINVYAVLLSTESEASEEDGLSARGAVLLSGLSLASDGAAAAIGKSTRDQYRQDHSWMAGTNYYMNHCAACGAKQGDFFLHTEPDGPFFLQSEGQFRGLSVTRFEIPAKFRADSANDRTGRCLGEFFLAGAIPDNVIGE